MFQFLSRFDGFREAPEEFVNTTTRGGILTICTWGFMWALLVCELKAFFQVDFKTTIELDNAAAETIELYFDILMHELPCRFASVDLVDDFGEETTNVTANIVKINKHWKHGELLEGGLHEDEEALQEVEDELPEEIDRFNELDKGGHHALAIDSLEDFDATLKAHHLTFVNFMAPWCHWCKKLEPKWEEAALNFDKIKFAHRNLDVKFATMDCEKWNERCAEYRVRAFPALLLFKGVEPIFPFYDGQRTVKDLDKFFSQAVHDYEDHMPNIYKNEACQIVGWLTVARVPGNFHIEARSANHDLSPSNSNLSHVVNHLSFGLSVPPSMKKNLEAEHQFLTSPLDGAAFVAAEPHRAITHFVKVVTVFLEGYPTFPFYEMTSQSRTFEVPETEIPEAKFVFDFSPLAVTLQKETIRWYQFLTSLLALVGGTFTVVQLFDGVLGSVGKIFKRN